MRTESVSSIQKYNTCPAQYRLHYLLNIRKESSNQGVMDRGTCVHAGMEAYLKAFEQSKEDRFELAYVASERCEIATEGDNVRNEAREILEYYLPFVHDRNLSPIFYNDFPVVEFEFDARFKSYGVSLQGKIDAVVTLPDGRVAMIDWKVRGNANAFSRPYPLQMDNQLPVYAGILRNVYGIKIDVAFQVQMNATLPGEPNEPILYKGKDPLDADSYYLRGSTTAEAIRRCAERNGLPYESLFVRFFDKVVSDSPELLQFTEVDLSNANKFLSYTLHRAKAIQEDTQYLPIMNLTECKFCPVLVECREQYFGNS